MKGNNPKLILLMLMHIKRLVRFCQFVLKILSRNKILTSIKGHNSVKIWRKMTGKNSKLDLVNVDVQNLVKFCQFILNERKQNSDINQGPLLRQNFGKNDGQQSQARSCQC